MKIELAKDIGGPTPVDAYLTIALLRQMNSTLPILEVGVFTGGFIICHLRNDALLNAVGIDPFPGLDDFKKQLFKNLDFYEVSNRYIHYDNLDQVNSNQEFSLIHLDGEHSELALTRDLSITSKLLAPNGLIVVDDFFHLDFPGVSSAVYEFLHHNDFSSFMITGSKIYLCKSNQYNEWYKKARKIMDDVEIDYEIDHEPIFPSQSYRSSNAINGFKNLIVKYDPGKERELRIALGLEQPRLIFNFLTSAIKFLFPGAVIFLIRFLKSFTR